VTELSLRAEQFAAAAHAVVDLVSTIPEDAWDGPGLGEWDLRALVGHTSRALLTVETYLGHPAEHEDVGTSDAYVGGGTTSATNAAAVAGRGVAAGAALGADPATAFAAIVTRVLPLVNRDDDPLITTIAGGMRLSVYLPTRTLELVVHGLDIADALGAGPPAFPPEVWSATLSLAARAAVVRERSPELLRAMTGRAPLPPGFSVV